MPWVRLAPTTKADLRAVRNDRKKARFLLDQNVIPALAGLLRSRGQNTVHALDVGLGGHSDEDVFAYAYRENRILITHDADFLKDREFPRHRNPGVIVLPGANGDMGAMLRAMNNVVAIVGQSRNLWNGTKVSIAADGVWTVSVPESDVGKVVTTRYRFSGRAIEVWAD